MIYIYIDSKLNCYIKQIKYTFKSIFRILGITYKFINSFKDISEKDIVINYGRNIKNKNFINIQNGCLFSEMYLTLKSIKFESLKRYDNIPVIYQYGTEDPYINYEKYIITNIDIVQSIFFMLTRYEEVLLFDKIKRDKYGRFPESETLAYKEKFLDIPIVDVYIEFFMQFINYFDSDIKKNNLWGKNEFVALITHDVDTPFKYVYNLDKDIVRAKYLRFDIIKDIYLHTLSLVDYKYDEFYTFNYIRKIEKKYNIKSAFYFMSGGNSIYDNYYSLKDYRIRSLIEYLEKDGCELGYHYSFSAFNDFEMMREEKEKLDEYLINKNYGGRNHYLRFKSPDTWRIAEKNNILYDTTLGYSNYLGFRCGTCNAYKVFDIKKNNELNLWEIPLTVMDISLVGENNISLIEKNSMIQINKYINIVKKYNGIFVLLWHNSSLKNSNWKKGKNVFNKTLECLYNNNAKFMTGIEIVNKLEDYKNE
ncbi:Uncharacterised protein [Clostridium carnis]|uniref:DUF7033 domain-containing protein n=1 Tax=Clostridium carnis TaxID=1530 RepID=A0ABY6SUZ0_9CLOT|nr:polysaccharide deacetylase family protein [Clostridium carnis]VDG72438.1 Uncharacterised protein [Clostridium carnis]